METIANLLILIGVVVNVSLSVVILNRIKWRL